MGIHFYPLFGLLYNRLVVWGGTGFLISRFIISMVKLFHGAILCWQDAWQIWHKKGYKQRGLLVPNMECLQEKFSHRLKVDLTCPWNQSGNQSSLMTNIYWIFNHKMDIVIVWYFYWIQSVCLNEWMSEWMNNWMNDLINETLCHAAR